MIRAAVILAAALLGLAAPPAPAQDAPRPEWRLVVDGAEQREAARAAAPGVDRLVARWLGDLRADGFLMADVDSVVLDGLRGRVYVSRGARARIGRVRIEGTGAVDSAVVARDWASQPGGSFDGARLDADLRSLVTRMADAGYPLAFARVDALALDTLTGAVSFVIRVTPGPAARLVGVELAGAERTSAGFAARAAGLRPGMPLGQVDPSEVQRLLEETGFFDEVGAPLVVVSDSGTAVVRIPVEEASPGVFDLVLGYLPDPEGGGSVVGNGRLELRNLFGGGRRIELRLERLPGQVSSVLADVDDPYVLSSSFGLGGRFEGLQQDSLFGRQRYRGRVRYRLGGGFSLSLSGAREQVRPGLAGARIGSDGRQRVARATGTFAGGGLALQRVDAPRNPRRGVRLDVRAERGTVERGYALRTAEGDTARLVDRSRQDRLDATARVYVPTFARQGVVLGGEVGVVASDVYDAGDLYTFGGASTLRGYDEAQFRGRLVARGLFEYRLRLDRVSFAYVFADLGYVETPQGAARRPAIEASWHPGYGFGMQYGTAIGLVNVSYALNPDVRVAEGRVHVGLAFGI